MNFLLYCAGIGLPACVVFLGTCRADEPFEILRDRVYADRGEEKLAADVYVPTAAGRHPGVLVVHGGAWMTGTRAQLGSVAKRLAAVGYTAVAISYRLAPKHTFPAQFDDCRDAVRWMRRESAKLKIDPEHIGGYGYSAGGHLVMLLGMTDHVDLDDDQPESDDLAVEGGDSARPRRKKLAARKPAEDRTSARLQAVVAGGAPCNFQILPEDNRVLVYWLGGTRGEKPEVYRQASPTSFITRDDPPTFLFHGQKDLLVPVLSPLAMQALLKAAGVQAETFIVPNAGHIEALMNQEATTEAIKFFDKCLKPAPARD
jgi:triacylglycerol lipase